MRYILIAIFFYWLPVSGQTSIYDLQIQTKNGKQINLSEYKGQKIIIAAVGSQSLQKKGAFYYWDSLQSANPKVAIIILPANDFSTADSASASEGVTVPAATKAEISEEVFVKKDKGNNQDAVLQWLTHADKNWHFDLDVTTDNQIYIISESGILYAVLEKGVSSSVIDSLLKQEDVKQ